MKLDRSKNLDEKCAGSSRKKDAPVMQGNQVNNKRSGGVFLGWTMHGRERHEAV